MPVMCGKHLEGVGQGIAMTPDGERATWTATGVTWRGSLTYHTESATLAKLNGLCALFEYDIDEIGNATKGRVFEWK